MYRNWEALIKAKSLEVEEETLSSTYGRFHVEPLERGFGITIGNSLPVFFYPPFKALRSQQYR